MSSRNGYLGAQERALAPMLYRTLSDLAARLGDGEDDFYGLEKEATAELDGAGFRTDYIAIRRASDLLDPAAEETELVILAAAYLGKARLIDNIEVNR